MTNVSATTTYNPIIPLVGRILIGLIFLVAGVRKVAVGMGFAGTVAYLTKLGFPAPEAMAVLAIVIEIGGSILLIVGWRTRWAAWLLALFVVVAAFAAHRFWEFTDPGQFNNQLNHFLKNLSIIGGLLYVATFGPGSASVDKT
ncbi:MAG TPA: DoxX family protein [Burkholderiales bacterium]|nr:DoxX family protein [Burkholderiales bacterium]